jgi:hypothetical protein|tara:strand:+ start:606 stop:848 length:243 start_codon:yes stop_codon:yes gene_type:complete
MFKGAAFAAAILLIVKKQDVNYEKTSYNYTKIGGIMNSLKWDPRTKAKIVLEAVLLTMFHLHLDKQLIVTTKATCKFIEN